MQLIIKVVPKSKLNKVTKIDKHTYLIHTTAPPDKGKANQTIIKLLSKELNIPKSNLSILKGKKSKNKIIQIQN